jgi:predicted HTH domain antitoxin
MMVGELDNISDIESQDVEWEENENKEDVKVKANSSDHAILTV